LEDYCSPVSFFFKEYSSIFGGWDSDDGRRRAVALGWFNILMRAKKGAVILRRVSR
jgi:hypothetical protein